MTGRRGPRGIGETYPPEISTYPPCPPGDRTDPDSYPPERSTSVLPVQGHESIDVTGDPGDRTLISTPRDARDEKTPTPDVDCDSICPHLSQEKFSAHHEKGLNPPPDHPDPPAHRWICRPDQRKCDADAQNPSPGEPGPIPREPEQIGPLAANYLDQLAAQQADDDLAARRREALNRLARQKPAYRPRETR